MGGRFWNQERTVVEAQLDLGLLCFDEFILEAFKCFKAHRHSGLWWINMTWPQNIKAVFSATAQIYGHCKQSDIFTKAPTIGRGPGKAALFLQHELSLRLAECIHCPVIRLTTMGFQLNVECTFAGFALNENSRINPSSRLWALHCLHSINICWVNKWVRIACETRSF